MGSGPLRAAGRVESHQLLADLSCQTLVLLLALLLPPPLLSQPLLILGQQALDVLLTGPVLVLLQGSFLLLHLVTQSTPQLILSSVNFTNAHLNWAIAWQNWWVGVLLRAKKGLRACVHSAHTLDSLMHYSIKDHEIPYLANLIFILPSQFSWLAHFGCCY